MVEPITITGVVGVIILLAIKIGKQLWKLKRLTATSNCVISKELDDLPKVIESIRKET